MTQEGRPPQGDVPKVGPCEEKRKLLQEFLAAIHDLVEMQRQQTQAVIDGDPDFGRFDLLLDIAQQRKEEAKYAWIAHVEAHHCEER